MPMPDVCKYVGINDHGEGMRTFCVVEMFMAYIHILNSLCIVRLAPEKYSDYTSHKYYGKYYDKLTMTQWVMYGTYAAFVITLLAQAVCGILLFVIGFQKKNAKIILVWMIVAILDFTYPVLLFICRSFEAGYMYDLGAAEVYYSYGGIPKEVRFFWLYMLYLVIGFPVVANYYKRLKEVGITPPGGDEQNSRAVQGERGTQLNAEGTV